MNREWWWLLLVGWHVKTLEWFESGQSQYTQYMVSVINNILVCVSDLSGKVGQGSAFGITF